MVPSSPQLAPRVPKASAMLMDAPPPTGTFFILPPSKNPSHSESGEKNGYPSLVSVTSLASVPARARRYKARPPRRLVSNARYAPFGEIANDSGAPTNCSPAGREMVKRPAGAGEGAAGRRLHTARLPASMPTSRTGNHTARRPVSVQALGV